MIILLMLCWMMSILSLFYCYLVKWKNWQDINAAWGHDDDLHHLTPDLLEFYKLFSFLKESIFNGEE